MSEQHDFDELARRKLDELRFSPREEDWLAAQRLIADARPAKKRRRALILFALLGLIAGAGWWLAGMPSAEKEEVSEVVRPNSTSATDERHTEQQSVPTENTPDPARTAGMDRTASNATPVVEQPASRDATAVGPPALKTTPPQADRHSAAPQARQKTDTPRTLTNDGVIAPAGVPNGSKSAKTSDQHGTIADATTPLTPGLIHTSVDATPQDEPPGSESNVGSIATFTAPDDTVDSSAKTPATGTTKTTDDYYAAADSNTLTTTRDTAALAPSTSAIVDSSVTVIDTTTRTTDARSPWEFSILGGAVLSTSTYSGGTSDLWSAGSTGRWAPSLGAEFMHMGRNFGIGGGVHHITYAEDLDVSSQSINTTVIRDSNYFRSVDTTLFIVTGTTVIDGQTYYITQPFQTMVQILINGTATSISTQELVRALKAANRVSYLEIPLLGDAHLDRGAWSFGIRGGPTIGLLTSRSGSLPTTISDGSLVNGERTFKSTVFGATGRAYIRYRFCSAWALGLEPFWRTQFGNALGSGDMVRRNSGWGGSISLSYRLR